MNYNKVVVPKKGSRKGVQKKDGVIVSYHGPYVDSSGEKFYLLQKWTLCPTTSDDGKTQHRYKECGRNYSFKPDETKGGPLRKCQCHNNNNDTLYKFEEKRNIRNGGHARELDVTRTKPRNNA